MAKYRVGVYETKFSYIDVKADSKEDALSKAWDTMSEHGTPEDAREFDRDFGTSNVEEIKDD